MMKNIAIYFFVILIVNSGFADKNYDMDEELFGSGKGHESHYVSFKKIKQDWKGFQSQSLCNEWQKLFINQFYNLLVGLYQALIIIHWGPPCIISPWTIPFEEFKFTDKCKKSQTIFTANWSWVCHKNLWLLSQELLLCTQVHAFVHQSARKNRAIDIPTFC